MYKKVILKIVLPPLDSNCYIVKTYKVSGSKNTTLMDVLFMLIQRISLKKTEVEC